MEHLSLKGMKKIAKSLLVLLLVFFMQAEVITVNTQPIVAETTYSVEVVGGYGAVLTSNVASDVILEGVQTGYSYKGHTPVGGYTNGPTSGTGNSLNSNTFKATVTNFEITYGTATLTVTHAAGNTSLDKTVYYNSASNTLSLADTGGDLKVMKVAVNSNTIAMRFFNILNNLKVVERFSTERNIVIKNVKSASTEGFYYTNESEDNVTTIHTTNIGKYEAGYIVPVTKLDNATVTSIDVYYANKYSYTIPTADLNSSFYIKKNATSPYVCTKVTASSSTSNTPIKYDNGTFTIFELAGNLTITYHFTYDVKFDANGGKIGANNDVTLKAVDGKVTALPNDPTRENDADGHTFKFNEWQDAENKTVTVDTVYTDNATVKANWKQNYKVTFDANGGTFNPSVTNAYLFTDSVNFNGKLSSLLTVNKTKDVSGTTYYFVGWFDGTDITTATKVDTNTVFSADTTLHAGWTDTTYEVTFDCDKTNTGLDSLTQTVGSGMNATAPTNTPQKDGYYFAGWFTDNTYTTKFDFENTSISADKTIYGQYIPCRTFTLNNSVNTMTSDDTDKFLEFKADDKKAIVKYNEDNNTVLKVGMEHGTIKNIKVTIGSTVLNINDLIVDQNSKSYYINENNAIGNSSGTNDQMSISYNADDEYFTVSLKKLLNNVSIEVSYEKIEITYIDIVDKDSEAQTISSTKIDFGSLIEEPNDAIKAGYNFVGWYADKDFEDEFDYSKRAYDDTEIYAKFKKHHEVTFVMGYGRQYDSRFLMPGIGTFTNVNDTFTTTIEEDYLDGPTSGSDNTNNFQPLFQVDVESVDVYYKLDYDTIQTVHIPHVTSAKGNSVMKACVYLDNGVLKVNNNAASFPSNVLNIIKFAASGDTATANMAIRTFNITGDLIVVFNYYNNNKITINNVKSIDTDNISEYNVNSTTNTITVPGTFANNTNPIIADVTTKESKLIDNINIKIGDNTPVTILGKNSTKTYYLNKDNKLSETAASTDILKYENGEFSFYSVNKNITIDYEYKKKVTFLANGGEFSGTETGVRYTTNSKVEAFPENPTKEGKYFAGWYDGADYTTANYITQSYVFDQEENEVYAGWSDTPYYFIAIENAHSSLSDDVIATDTSDKYVNFDGVKGLAVLEEGTDNVQLKMYASYGTLSGIKCVVGNEVVDAVEALTTSSTYSVTDQDSTTTFTIQYFEDNKYINVDFVNLAHNITIILEYEDVTVDFLYEDETAAAPSVTIPFNTLVEKPTEPVKEHYAFDNWYVSKDFTEGNLFDFETTVMDDTVVYANMVDSYKVEFVGTGYKTTNKIVSSTWEELTNGKIDTEKAYVTTFGEYNNETGVTLNAYAKLSAITSIDITYKGVTNSFDADDLKGTKFLTAENELTTTDSRKDKEEGDILKFVINENKLEAPNTEEINLRFYHIDADIKIELNYKEVSAKFDNTDNAITGFVVDDGEEFVNIDDGNMIFTTHENVFGGINDQSVRLNLTPVEGYMIGLELYTVEGETETLFKTWKYGDSADAIDYENIGKIALGYSTTDGHYYVRFLYLQADVVVKPILVDQNSEPSKVTINSAEGLSVDYEALSTTGPNKDVTVSADNKTITVPLNSLPTKAVGESFKWNLGSTAGCDQEYYDVELVVGEKKYTINTNVASYKVSGKDVSAGIHTPEITVLYNKGKNGDAQIRVWGVCGDAQINVHYKDYNSEETYNYSELDFTRGEAGNNYSTKLIQAKGLYVDIEALSTELPNKDVIVSEDYKTLTVPYGTLTSKDVGYSVRWNLASTAGTGYEYNKIEVLNSDDEVIATVGAAISSYLDTSTTRVLATGYKSPFISFAYNKAVSGEAQIRVWGVNDNTSLRMYYKNYETGEVVAAEDIDFNKADASKAPYDVNINMPSGLYLSYEALSTELPNKDVIISEDMKTVTVPSFETLSQKTTGYSFRWNLGATAGTDLEYYKLEIYDDNDELIYTLGDKLISWKESSVDQTVGIRTTTISVLYSKSRLSEAQLRFWSVACDVKFKIYFKNYQTGEVFSADEVNFERNDDSNSPYEVNILTGKGISIEYETLADELINKGIKISDDFHTFTVPHGSLTSKNSKESVRWNLGNTCGTGYEYGKLEILDSEGNTIVTIGEALSSYVDATADQTIGIHSPLITVSYNKGRAGDAQIRIWGVTDDITLRVYYKNYTTNEVIPAEEFSDNTTHTVKIKYADSNESRAFGLVDYRTEDTKVTYNSKGIATSVTLGRENLTGKNRQIKENKEGDLTWYTSNILRVRFNDVGRYYIDSVTISTGTGENAVTKTFKENESAKVKGLGDIAFVVSNNTRYVRINGIYTTEDLVITPNIVEGEKGPYTVSLVTDDDLHVTYYSTNPKEVSVTKDNKTIYVQEGQLPSSKDGESVRWDLSSTAGMDFEYSKMEVYEYNPDTKAYDTLVKTFGEKFVSYKEAGKDQSDNQVIRGCKIRLNKSQYGEVQLRIYDVYRNFKFVFYYKNYETGEEYKANDEHLKFVYDGVVSIKLNGTTCELENFDSKLETKINGVNKIRFNKFVSEADGLRYILNTSELGDNIDYITVTVNGKSVDMGKDLEIGKASGKNFAGAKVRYYRNTDGWAIIRVYAVTDDIEINVHVSHGHKNTLTFNVGDHGTYRVTDIPASAKTNKDWTKVVLLRGSTYNSTHGNKSSVRYDVTPDVGWEIAYLVFTVNGKSYTLNPDNAKKGSTIVTEIAPGCSVKFNLDSNGVAQIRFVHVDADTSCKVYYRSNTYKVKINNQKLSLMRAEGYGTSADTVFTKNYAVATINSGETVSRQNGIKYWLAPQDGHVITSAVVENSKGEYVICGEGFSESQYEDYKVKGITVRYYQGYDGKIEIRYWGVRDNIKITVFYDGEKPVVGTKLPDDLETYDIGEYVEPVDSKNDLIGDRYVEEEAVVEEDNKISLPVIIGAGGTVVVALALILTKKFWIKLFKK